MPYLKTMSQDSGHKLAAGDFFRAGCWERNLAAGTFNALCRNEYDNDTACVGCGLDGIGVYDGFSHCNRRVVMQPSSNIVKLRHLLADRSAHLRQGVSAAPPMESFATGTFRWWCST